MDKVNEIKRFIANKGIEADIIEHKLLGLKSEDAAKATGFYIGNIIKTLLFVSEDNTIVTICLGVDKIDIEKLSGISGLKKVGSAISGLFKKSLRHSAAAVGKTDWYFANGV